MVAELNLIKPQIEFDFVNSRFTDEFHLINDTIIPYGFFLKVYVIQKKISLPQLSWPGEIEKAIWAYILRF